MRSTRLVLWRGALALALVAGGLGTGLGMSAAQIVMGDDIVCDASPGLAAEATEATEAATGQRAG